MYFLTNKPDIMNAFELKADLKIKMIELGRAIDQGRPYPEIKIIYERIKQIQLELLFDELSRPAVVRQNDSEIVLE